MPTMMETWSAHLLRRLAVMQHAWGSNTPTSATPTTRFADVLDSMALVEFLALLAGDCGVTVEHIEECAGRRYGTVADLAAALTAAGLSPPAPSAKSPSTSMEPIRQPVTAWLGPVTVKLPDAVQPAAAINDAIGRPAGWLEKHAGIQARRVWEHQDPLEAAAAAGLDCLHQAGLRPEEVGTLLVTSEAPPMLLGLAGALHHRLHLSVQTPALEIGGACTGFLAALMLGRGLLPQAGIVLIVAVEAPTAVLRLARGSAGEAAALFGDAAAAGLLSSRPLGAEPLGLVDVFLRTDGSANGLLQAVYHTAREVAVHFKGVPLAERAIRAMASAVRELASRGGRSPADLAAVVAHGGNGRMPDLLARQLDLPLERVWSETTLTGNLGSVSLPAAWVRHAKPSSGQIVWTAAGAGLSWGAAMLDTTPWAAVACKA